MQQKIAFSSIATLVVMLFVLAACGGSAPATINDIPVYPDAAALQAGKDQIATTLANNMTQDASMRQAMGVDGKTEQKGFELPKEAQWDAVKRFYTDKLKAAGWSEGMGNSIAGNLVGNVLDVANQANDMFKLAAYSKGSQTLSVMYLVMPDSNDKVLMLSLSTR